MPSTGDLYAGPSSQRICHSKYANMYKSAWGDKEQYAHSVKFGQEYFDNIAERKLRAPMDVRGEHRQRLQTKKKPLGASFTPTTNVYRGTSLHKSQKSQP
eukprot:Platyproteum_vivax@DN6547_c0_g1_i1.p1